MSDAISVHDLSYAYRSWPWRPAVQALRGVSITVARGRAHALLGANGAGKSTLLRHLAGLHPHRGAVRVLGGAAGDAAVRERVAFLPEPSERGSRVRVGDALRLEAELHGIGRAERSARIEAVLREVGMQDHAHRSLRSLSTGQRRRVGFAQVLLPDAELLLLDEPFSGVDPDWTRRLCQSLRSRLERGGTIVFSTHRLEDVEALAHSLSVFEAGRVAAEGRLDEILDVADEWQVHVRGPQSGGGRVLLERWLTTLPDGLVAQVEARRRSLHDVFAELRGRRP